jgi:hypothetical protein
VKEEKKGVKQEINKRVKTEPGTAPAASASSSSSAVSAAAGVQGDDGTWDLT